MPKTRFIGDVHGKFGAYKRLIAGCERSVQVGDMGVGFRHRGGPRDGEFYATPPYDAMVRGGHRFIGGTTTTPRHAGIIRSGSRTGTSRAARCSSAAA